MRVHGAGAWCGCLVRVHGVCAWCACTPVHPGADWGHAGCRVVAEWLPRWSSRRTTCGRARIAAMCNGVKLHEPVPSGRLLYGYCRGSERGGTVRGNARGTAMGSAGGTRGRYYKWYRRGRYCDGYCRRYFRGTELPRTDDGSKLHRSHRHVYRRLPCQVYVRTLQRCKACRWANSAVPAQPLC